MEAAVDWYRFESRTTLGLGEKLPFDLLYVIPKEEKALFAKVYDVFLYLEPEKELLETLLNRQLSEVKQFGRKRAQDKSRKLKAPESVAQNMTLPKDPVFCVPVLPRRTKSGVQPAYIATADIRKKLTKQHETFSKYQLKRKQEKTEAIVSQMTLVVGGQDRIPCVTCGQALQKAANPMFCTLGTDTCLTKVRLSGVSTFKEKTAKGTVPEEFPALEKEAADVTRVLSQSTDQAPSSPES